MHLDSFYHWVMTKNKFKPRSLAETIRLLAELKGMPFWKDGRPKPTAIAKEAKIDPSLISRILSGRTDWMTDENVAKLSKVFRVNSAQMRGEEPIDAIDGSLTNEKDAEFIERFKSHPDELKQALRAVEQAWLSENRPDQ